MSIKIQKNNFIFKIFVNYRIKCILIYTIELHYTIIKIPALFYKHSFIVT